MIQDRTIYDISVSLGEESIDYPGDTPFFKELIWTIKKSGVCDLTRLELSTHAGTHIDAPAHFFAGGRTLDSYTPGDFIFPARVVHIEDKTAIHPDALENLHIQPGAALLFKTDNSTSGRCRNGVFSEKFVYLTPEAADLCVEKKAGLVGVDYITIDRYGDENFPVHRALLGNDILVLEGINLHETPPGSYTLMCLPLKIKGAEASPVRAILVGGRG